MRFFVLSTFRTPRRVFQSSVFVLAARRVATVLDSSFSLDSLRSPPNTFSPLEL